MILYIHKKITERVYTMDNKMIFNEDVEIYEKYRPSYIPQLYHDIAKYSNMNDKYHVLEIGAGTGQATEWFVSQNVHLTAIDIGNNMTQHLQKKFYNIPNVIIKNCSFENYKAENNSIDLIYSATAFHWLDEDFAMKKIKELLKSNGTIALFWNHPFVNRKNDKLHVELRKIYNKYRPNDKSPKEFDKKATKKYLDLLNKHGFNNVVSKLYYRERRLTAKDYIGLLNTYSDHKLLPDSIKESFENEIYELIYKNGNLITIYDTIDLYLGKYNKLYE